MGSGFPFFSNLTFIRIVHLPAFKLFKLFARWNLCTPYYENSFSFANQCGFLNRLSKFCLVCDRNFFKQCTIEQKLLLVIGK